MSRLFDALKESGNLRQGTERKVGDEVWNALGITPAGSPQALSDPDISIENGSTELADELMVAPDETLFEVVDTEPGGPAGTAIKVALDPKARLIPHAVDPAAAESYRKLRTKIIQQQAEKPFRSLLVTSAGPEEGKTVTVLNLGLSFAALPSRVLVIDGDLRRGTLGEWLGVNSQRPGLSNLIDGSAQLNDVILKSDDIQMDLIVRGTSKISDLASSELGAHLAALRDEYDLILVDSPPVNLLADVQLLAESCDAVLMVARAFSTTRASLESALRELTRFHTIGMVLNAGTARHYGYSSDYY